MSKILIIGDCHIGEYPNDKQIETEIDYAFEQIQEYVQKNNISFAFSVGDIVRKKKGTPQLSVSILGKIDKHLTGVFAISGNHDQDEDNFFTEENDSFCTSKSVVSELHNIRCLDNDSFQLGNDVMIFGTPFYRNSKDFYKALEAIQIEEGSKNILIIHQTPSPTAFSETCSDTIDINHALFKKFSLVVCGHIHNHIQLLPNFWQIGSLAPMNRNELEQKFFLSVDTKTLEAEAIPLKQNIQFAAKKEIKQNAKLSKQVIDTAKAFDLPDAALKYAEENNFTKFQIAHSQNTIKKI